VYCVARPGSHAQTITDQSNSFPKWHRVVYPCRRQERKDKWDLLSEEQVLDRWK
jgi:hypothetical protein